MQTPTKSQIDITISCNLKFRILNFISVNIIVKHYNEMFPLSPYFPLSPRWKWMFVRALKSDVEASSYLVERLANIHVSEPFVYAEMNAILWSKWTVKNESYYPVVFSFRYLEQYSS